MALEVKVLDLGDIELESSFLVLARDCGRHVRVPSFGFLITGGAWPIVVDTAYRSTEIMQNLGMRGIKSEEQKLENQLARHGLKVGDVRYVLHTHMHIDHGGQDDRFPMTTTVCLNRRELEYAASGIMGEQYPCEDVKHLIDRLHTKGALRLLDLEGSGGEEIMPGVVCVAAGGHTEGSMNILVETAQGICNICGDVIYDVQDQLVEPLWEVVEREPQVTGNHGMSKRAEKSAIKKVLNTSTFICPAHDRPAMLDRGRVVGRLHDQVPGPVTQGGARRNWFAA
jgi:glyoxylase-like metal-dependent hydrolase (beta-lactamase superfamily II)